MRKGFFDLWVDDIFGSHFFDDVIPVTKSTWSLQIRQSIGEDESLIYAIDIPGIPPENVTITNGQEKLKLTIKRQEDKSWSYGIVKQGEFDYSETTASLKYGVLILKIPKKLSMKNEDQIIKIST